MIQPLVLSCLLGVSLAAQDAAAPRLIHDPGFEVRVIAEAARIVAPIAVDWDATGRAFVLQGNGVLAVLGELGGVFHSGIESPSGFLLHRDGALVAREGGVEFEPDRDGDFAAEEPELLFGLPAGARLAGLTRGPDGWVYAVLDGLGVGDETTELRNGVVRFLPDAGQPPELVAAIPAARSVVVREDGELLVATDEAHFAHIVLPDSAFSGGRAGRVASFADTADHSFVARAEARRSPGGGTFGAAGGSVLLSGALFGRDFEGDRLVCEPEGGVVHRDKVELAGVLLRGRRAAETEFLASPDPDFHPTSVAIGPGGELWVLDAGAPGESGGRILGIAPKVEGASPFPMAVAPLDRLPSQRLLGELSSPDPFRRRMAARLLRERELDPVTIEVLTARALGETTPGFRMRALWFHADSALVRRSLAAFEPSVRRVALRVLLADAKALRRLSVGDIRTRTRDEDGRVRLLALLAWSRRPSGGSPSEIVALYPNLSDDWSRSAALAVAAERPALILASLIRNGSEAAFGEFVDLLAADVARRGDRSAAVSMVLELRGGEKVPHLASIILDRFDRNLTAEPPWPSPRLSTTLRHLASSENLSIATAALPLAVRWMGDLLAPREVDGWCDRLRAVVPDEGRSLETRLASLDALLRVPRARDSALALAAPHAGERAWDTLLERPRTQE